MGRMMAIAAAAGLVLAAPANAGQVIYSFAGTVNGFDRAGYFGAANSALTNRPFTVDYTWDPSITPDYYLRTWSSQNMVSDGRFNPLVLSAVLTINGMSYTFGGALSQVYRNNGIGPGSGGNPFGNDVIASLAHSNHGFFETMVYAPYGSSGANVFDSPDLTSPLALAGASGINPGSFTIFRNPSTNQSSAFGTLTITTVNVTTNGSISIAPPRFPLPEPSVWAMLIAGFGLVGAMQRRRQLA